MFKRLPVIKPKQAVKILKKIGFVERSQTGSHLILSHSDTNKIIPIPIHVKELKKGTLLNILRQAEITREDLHGLL